MLNSLYFITQNQKDIFVVKETGYVEKISSLELYMWTLIKYSLKEIGNTF